MSFIDARWEKRGLSSLIRIRSVSKALMHSNLPLRWSWIANDVH